MDKIVSFHFGTQFLDIYVDDIPKDTTPQEIRDMALDIFEMNMTYQIFETNYLSDNL